MQKITEKHLTERLVSIESQAEFDLLSGERVERLFLKMYVAARTSGLVAAISDRDWKTLCVMATYMDKDGYCFPSQVELAPALGCSRQMVSERVNSLARFRFHGQPVFLVVKGEHTKAGTWARNGYRVLPIANLEIFGNKRKQAPTQSAAQQKGENSTMSRKLDTVKNPEATVSSPTGTVQLDTNYTQYTNKISFSNIRREKNEKTTIESVAHVIQRKYPMLITASAEDDTLCAVTLQMFLGNSMTMLQHHLSRVR